MDDLNNYLLNLELETVIKSFYEPIKMCDNKRSNIHSRAHNLFALLYPSYSSSIHAKKKNHSPNRKLNSD